MDVYATFWANLTIPCVSEDFLSKSYMFNVIKTHNSESRGQEGVDCMWRMSVLFIQVAPQKLADAVNKPP